MTLLWLLIGSVPPALCGWLLLHILEGRTSVLQISERIAMGFTMGLTAFTFLAFLLQVALGVPFSRTGFLLSWIVFLCLGLLGFLFLRRYPHETAASAVPAGAPLTPVRLLVLALLCAWTLLKVASLGGILLSIPSYLDDTASNWNLRAKVLFETQRMELRLPGSDDVSAISSYPPSVPLAKAWYVSLPGAWDEGTANGVHLLWFIALLTLTYAAVRRHASRLWAVVGVYVLVSLPLELMHGTNAYADLFLSLHLFCAVFPLMESLAAPTPRAAGSWLRIAAAATALIPFTKNEGFVLYLPLLLVLWAVTLWMLRRTLGTRGTLRMAGAALALLALVAVPWLAFKWMHGLSFGNAKSLSAFQIGWQPNVPFAILVNTFFEGNWLLFFPALIGLLIARFRDAFRGPLLIPTLFVLGMWGGQLLLYLFTGLAAEAIKQTGYARGLVHFMPVAVVLLTVLLRNLLQAKEK
jgi:hypothetical protein